MSDALILISRLRNPWPVPVTRMEQLQVADELEALREERDRLRAALEHIRRCVRYEPSMNARVVIIHEGSSTMDQIDAALGERSGERE